MKNIARFLVCMGVGSVLLLPPVSAQGVRSVSVRLTRPAFAAQQESQWCWAATVSNLFAYHGYDVRQARVVEAVYGTVVNGRSGNYANMARLLNRSWKDESGRTFRSTLVAALDLLNGINAIDNDNIRDALENDRPLVIGTTDHAMLVVGMRFTEFNGRVAQVLGVDVFDPWPGQGLRAARPAEVTPVPLGGSLMFIAEAKVGESTGVAPPPQMGRSCQTPVGRCGPFFDQPAQPVGSPCYCGTYGGPVAGSVVR